MFDFNHLSQAGIHPLMVHFPIALYIVALICDGIGLILRRPQKLQFTAFILTIIGTIGAIAAVLSGNQAEELATFSKVSENIMDKHESMATITMWLGIVTSILRSLFMAIEKLSKFHNLILIPSILLTYLVIQTGHLGGKLVFGHGVGVNQQNILNKQPDLKNDDHELEECD